MIVVRWMKIYASFPLLMFFFLAGCSQKEKETQQIETATAGSVEIYCDEAYIAFFQPLIQEFMNLYPEAQVRLVPVSARKAVGELFQGKARAIIIGRDFLRDEDSLLHTHKVTFPEIRIAKDALVFYALPEFPLDTLSHTQLVQLFRDGIPLEKIATLKEKVEIVVPEPNSSIYGNLMQFFTEQKPVKIPLRTFSTADSVYHYIKKHQNALGVGYLSQVAFDTTIKMIRIGFRDTTGTYVYPTRYPHQALIVMGLYPYVVPIKGILREDLRNLPWGVLTFLERDPKSVQYYKDQGIVPEFAVIKIKAGE